MLFAMQVITDILMCPRLEKTSFEEMQEKTKLDFSNGRGDDWKKQIKEAHEWLMSTPDSKEIVFGFSTFIGYLANKSIETDEWIEGMWDIYEAAGVPKLITMSIHTAFFG